VNGVMIGLSDGCSCEDRRTGASPARARFIPLVHRATREIFVPLVDGADRDQLEILAATHQRAKTAVDQPRIPHPAFRENPAFVPGDVSRIGLLVNVVKSTAGSIIWLCG